MIGVAPAAPGSVDYQPPQRWRDELTAAVQAELDAVNHRIGELVDEGDPHEEWCGLIVSSTRLGVRHEKLQQEGHEYYRAWLMGEGDR